MLSPSPPGQRMPSHTPLLSSATTTPAALTDPQETAEEGALGSDSGSNRFQGGNGVNCPEVHTQAGTVPCRCRRDLLWSGPRAAHPPHLGHHPCSPHTAGPPAAPLQQAHMGVHRQPVEQESRTPQDSVVLSGGKLTGSTEAGSRQEWWAELSAPAEHSGYLATRLIFTRDARPDSSALHLLLGHSASHVLLARMVIEPKPGPGRRPQARRC